MKLLYICLSLLVICTQFPRAVSSLSTPRIVHLDHVHTIPEQEAIDEDGVEWVDPHLVHDLDEPIHAVSNAGDCIPSPSVIDDIHRLRTESTKVADLLQHETMTLHERKEFVKSLTKYINERIVELNQVKSELGEELKLVELAQQQLQEFSQQEELIKLQDALSCLHTKTEEQGEDHSENISHIEHEISEVQQAISGLQSKQKTLKEALKTATLKLGQSFVPPHKLEVEHYSNPARFVISDEEKRAQEREL